MLAAGCGHDLAEPIAPPAPHDGGDIIADAGPMDGAVDAAVDAAVVDATVEGELQLGLKANAATTLQQPTAPELLLAEQTVLALKVRSVVLPFRWDSLDATALEALKVQVQRFRDSGLKVVLALQVVFRHEARKPAAIAQLSWDDPGTLEAINETIDQLLELVGDELYAIVLGRETDAYLLDHPGELTPLSAFLTHAMGHLSSKMDAPFGAVGLSFSASPPSSSYLALLELGNIYAVSYLPELGQPIVASEATPAKDLDSMIVLAAGRPTVLQAVGYTSAIALGSSADLQAERLGAFFQALQSRRSQIPIASVEQLHDLSDNACGFFAASQGLPKDDAEVEFVCNGGLRDQVSTAKPAWSTFVAASAANAAQ